jgi:hypothetical protein
MNRFLLLFGGIWFLVGLPFAVVGVYVWTAEREFERDARVARGIVLSKDINRSRNNNGSTSTSYSVRYRFTPPGGRALEGASGVDRDDWNQLSEREPIDIAYLPSDPSNNRVRGTRKMVLAWIFTGLGSLFTVAGAVILAFGLRGSARHKRLRATGMTADAVVTRVLPANVRVNKRQQARVLFEFRDDRGGTHAGKSSLMPIDEAMAWKAGDGITIRYDRDRPKDSLWDPP